MAVVVAADAAATLKNSLSFHGPLAVDSSDSVFRFSAESPYCSPLWLYHMSCDITYMWNLKK